MVNVTVLHQSLIVSILVTYLVQLFQVIDRHVLESQLSGFLAVILVTQNAHFHAWAGKVRKANTSVETFVFGGVIVLQTDLQFDGLQEFTLLSFLGLSFDSDFLTTGEGQQFLNGFFQKFV